MTKHYLLFIWLAFQISFALAQVSRNWSDNWDVLYQENASPIPLKIEINFAYMGKACLTNYYRIRSNFQKAGASLSFKIEYTSCKDEMNYFETKYVDLSKPLFDENWGNWIVASKITRYYDIKIEDPQKAELKTAKNELETIHNNYLTTYSLYANNLTRLQNAEQKQGFKQKLDQHITNLNNFYYTAQQGFNAGSFEIIKENIGNIKNDYAKMTDDLNLMNDLRIVETKVPPPLQENTENHNKTNKNINTPNAQQQINQINNLFQQKIDNNNKITSAINSSVIDIANYLQDKSDKALQAQQAKEEREEKEKLEKEEKEETEKSNNEQINISIEGKYKGMVLKSLWL